MSFFTDIWDKIAKDDGTGTRVIRYGSLDDLVFLYASGFVDAEKYDLKAWLEAFDSSKQSDGSYVINKGHWLEKEKFHYHGPIRDPFEAHLIPEKEFTEAELIELFNQCIVPSSQATKESIPNFIRLYENRNLLKNGKMMMTKEIKQELHDFIEAFPSPLRVLETHLHEMLPSAEKKPE